MACSTMSLTELVIHYEEHATKIRKTELEDDFSCARGKPKIHVHGNDILQHASTLYIHTIFQIFQDEFLQGMSECLMSSSNDGTFVIYTLQSESDQREHVVRFDSIDNNILCSCKLFESKGWLYRHAFRVFNIQVNIREIPSQYVLKRWTKGAKDDIASDELGPMYPKVVKFSKVVCLNKLMLKCFNVMRLCSDANDTTDLANTYLDCLAKEARIEVWMQVGLELMVIVEIFVLVMMK